jgi:hypothetical protein
MKPAVHSAGWDPLESRGATCTSVIQNFSDRCPGPSSTGSRATVIGSDGRGHWFDPSRAHDAVHPERHPIWGCHAWSLTAVSVS